MSATHRIPQFVEWQITAKCNLNCIHCSARHRNPRQDLTTPAATALVHELIDANLKSITFSGGEPLLRDDWELLAGILKENNVSVQLISNGQHLGEDAARRISRLGINFVWLSLDGPEQAHNTIRQDPKAFSRVMAAASHLEAMAVPYGFMTTLLATNFDQLPELGDIVRDTACALWQVWLGNKTSDAPIWLKPAQIHQIIEQLPILRRHTPQLIIGDNIGYGNALERLRSPEFVEYSAASRFTGCFGANTIMGILNDGTIKGCLSMPDLHPATSSPASLYQRYLEAMTLHQISVAQALSQCAGCAIAQKCNGGCPAWALSSNSDSRTRFCREQAAQQPLRTAAITASLATICAITGPHCQPSRAPQNTVHTAWSDTSTADDTTALPKPPATPSTERAADIPITTLDTAIHPKIKSPVPEATAAVNRNGNRITSGTSPKPRN